MSDNMTAPIRALPAKWQRHADYLSRPDSDGDAPTEGDYGVARGLYACADELERALAALPAEPAAGGEAVCYRLRTPAGKWAWIDGKPCEGTLRLARDNGYPIDYAFAATPAPRVDEDDTARLDWLETHGCGQFQGPGWMGADGERNWFDNDTIGSDYGPTLRHMIDAAMRIEREGIKGCKHERSYGAPWRCAKCGIRMDAALSPAPGGEGQS